MSRIALFALAALLPTAAPAQTLTAEQALETHRQAMSIYTPGCAPDEGSEPDEVVVCARRTRPSLRLPLTVERAPGARVRGEAMSAAAGLAPQRCTAWGANQSCNGGLPLARIAVTVAKGAAKIADALFNPD